MFIQSVTQAAGKKKFRILATGVFILAITFFCYGKFRFSTTN